MSRLATILEAMEDIESMAIVAKLDRHKECGVCHTVKPIDEFYPRKGSSDGRQYDCKACRKSAVRAYRHTHLEKVRQWTDHQKALEWSRLDRLNHPEEVRARAFLNHALRDGRIVKQPCERCGQTKSHGHHTDYSRPLDVRWLCAPCHGLEHRRVG